MHIIIRRLNVMKKYFEYFILYEEVLKENIMNSEFGMESKNLMRIMKWL